MKPVYTLMDVVRMLSDLPTEDIKAVGAELAVYDPVHAERLKNAIIVGQQELDQKYMDKYERELLWRDWQKRQAEVMADQDAVHYGERI